MRQIFITDALIYAVQQGKITNRDRGRVMEYLRLNNWRLDAQLGMRNDLWLEVLRACPMLGESADDTIPTVTVHTTTKPLEAWTPGFTKSEN
jgi:hypothetical protein